MAVFQGLAVAAFQFSVCSSQYMHSDHIMAKVHNSCLHICALTSTTPIRFLGRLGQMVIGSSQSPPHCIKVEQREGDAHRPNPVSAHRFTSLLSRQSPCIRPQASAELPNHGGRQNKYQHHQLQAAP